MKLYKPLELLKQEYQMLTDLIETGNYDMLIEIKNKTAEKIAILEVKVKTEAEKVKDEGRF